MSMTAVAAIGLALAIAMLVDSGRKPSRVRRLTQQSVSQDSSSEASKVVDPNRHRVVAFAACSVAGLAAILLLGGPLGWALAVGAVAFGPRILGKLEPKATRLHREAVVADAPLVAELLAACLQAGVSDQRAIRSVASALDGPIIDELGVVHRALSLGTDPSDAWAMLDRESPLAPIARAFSRSAQSGAPLSSLLTAVARELRAKHASSVEVAARSVAVKSVGPLGLCFLPAFILLGVVPLIASLFSQVAPL